MEYVVSNVLMILYKNIEINFKDHDKLLDIIKKYLEKQNPTYLITEQTTLKTSIITKVYYPKGIFKVYVENNDVYATFELMLALIMTKNKAVFEVFDNYEMIEKLVKIVNGIVNFEIFKINNNEFYDEVICIGSRSFLDELRNSLDSNILYFGYFKYDIYLSKEYEGKIAKLNSKDYIIYSNISVKEAVQKINELGTNFTSAIFSKNEDDIKFFMENCNSKNIYVNMLPSNKCYLDFDLNLFVKIKNVIISK